MNSTDPVLSAFWDHQDALAIVEFCPRRSLNAVVTWANRAFERLYGFEVGEFVGTRYLEFWHDQSAASEEMAGLFRTGKIRNAVHRLGGNGDGQIDLRVASCHSTGQLTRLVVLHTRYRASNTESVNAQEAQFATRRAERRLWDAIEALPEGFVLLDEEDKVVAFNSKFKELYGASAEAIRVGATFESVLKFGLDRGQYPDAFGREAQWLAERLDRASRSGKPLERQLPDGRHLKIQDVETSNGDMVGLRTDVTAFTRQREALRQRTDALEKAERNARTESLTDALTALGNRRGLKDFINSRECDEAQESRAALLHIDLDRFKWINDIFGHAAGDFVLKEVASLLRTSVRSTDYVARVGGDEFIILLVGYSDPENTANSIASRIVKSCGQVLSWEQKELRYGASVGIAITALSEVTEAIENADIALYDAKKNGKGQFSLFTPHLRKMAEEKKQLADELLVALADGELCAFYQPQVYASDYSIAGAEALVRWRHPRRGVLSPNEFLPIAEELGVVANIDELILQSALEAAALLTQRGICLPKVSVNVSYRRLSDPRLIESLARRPIVPCKLAFELVETIDFDTNSEEIRWVMDRLREEQIEIEVDDFGSGRASLTTLLQLMPDRLKIDRTLVRSMAEGTAGAPEMIQAIADICRSTSIGLTAEGVETTEQAIALGHVGATVLQGYLFSQPLPFDSFERWCQIRKGHSGLKVIES